MRIASEFAILDVMKGRRALVAKLPVAGGYYFAEPIPVIIHGFITHQHGDDDGTSIEFGMEVIRVICDKDFPPKRKS